MDHVYLEVVGGRRIDLGTVSDFDASVAEINRLTGGSSIGGEMANLWGLLYGPREGPMSIERYELVKRQAVTFQSRFADRLTNRCRALLRRVASSAD